MTEKPMMVTKIHFCIPSDKQQEFAVLWQSIQNWSVKKQIFLPEPEMEYTDSNEPIYHLQLTTPPWPMMEYRVNVLEDIEKIFNQHVGNRQIPARFVEKVIFQ